MIGYLDAVIKPLVLILSKMSEHVKTLKDKNGDKTKNNKLISLCVGDDKVLEKYKTIWTMIECL